LKQSAPSAESEAEGTQLHALAPARRLAVLRSLRGSGKTISLRTSGMSMQPMIPDDSRVEISFLDAGTVRPGDVVLFSAGEAAVLHRVLRVQRTGDTVRFVEKGDHQPFFRTVEGDCFLGILTAVETGGKKTCSDDAAWRIRAGLLLLLGRAEAFCYRVKVRCCGRSPSAAGRLVNRVLASVRRAVLRMTSGSGREGGGPG
jgi:hypothetical protein